jgi:xylulokinase
VFIGIDLGTSEVKALLLASDHSVVGVAGCALTISRPQPGYSEQSPEDWWTATRQALAQLRQAHPAEMAAVQAIGLSGQMHGAVLLDAQDRVLRPAILWNDTRCAAECAAMMLEMPALADLGGSLSMPGFTAPKLRWVARHEPDIFQQVAKVLLPKDYLRLMLTGEHVTDMSDASGTLWLDVRQRQWSDALLALTGMTRAQMPRLVEGSAPSGKLLPQVAAELGMPASTVVGGGAGDNASSAVGMGAVRAGQGFLSLGTSGVLFVVTPRYQPNADSATHAFCHALPGVWHQMSVMLTAASALQWVTHLLGAANAGDVAEQAAGLSLNARAASPIFLPYLGGERTPHNSATLRGSFHGLSLDTDPARLGYAVMEGVSFGLCDGLAALRAAGSQVDRLSLVGGGARSAFWAQLLASALNLEIVTHADSAVGGALGAARLAWLATGAEVHDVCSASPVRSRFLPLRDEQDHLTTRYARFRSLFRAE